MTHSSRLVASLGIALALGACGSRTGLFGTEPGSAALDGGHPLDAGPDAVPCTPGTFTLDVATAQMMFVLDRSGSMAFSLTSQSAPPPGQQTRWQILHDALEATILPFDASIAMGAKFFPEILTGDEASDAVLACRTDSGSGIKPQTGNARPILDVFGHSSPRGGTPTSEAIRIASDILAGSRGVARTMVVATDGAPNCNVGLDTTTCVCTTPRNTCASAPDTGRYSCLDDARTIATVRHVAEDEKIPVYVIGIGSTESPAFLQVLDDMAVAGGRPRATTPRHYNVQSAGELKDAITTIRDSIAQCTYLTPSAPKDPNQIAVEIDGALVPHDPTREDGWEWVDQKYGEMAFFGPACDIAKTGTPKVSGVVSCQ